MKTRLHILADLHLEFGTATIPKPDADVVVIAGDVHIGREGRKWIRDRFSDRPVIYVLGNHEYYRHSLPELTETLKRETEGSNIHILENSTATIHGITFLGCTLWTDFMIATDPRAAIQAAEEMMSDYSIIKNSEKRRVLRARDTIQVHSDSVIWLKESLAKCDPARTVVVTHHAPSRRSEAPYHAGSLLSAAFSSDLNSLVEHSRVPLWIHGHTHYNVDYNIGLTRVLANQRGYPDQRCEGFNPELIVEI